MKVICYKCDSCGKMIDNPYEEKMKEFYLDNIDWIGFNKKRKKKIHLCNECFKSLSKIKENKK